MGRPNRKERELTQRRQEVLVVAERLFSQKGFFKTSMAEVAHDSEFAVGSLYQLFPSKDAIYLALMEEKFKEYLALVHREVAAAKGVLDKIEALIAIKVGFFEKHRNFFRIYITEWGAGECSIKGVPGENIASLRQEYLALITATMQAGVKRRLFKKLDAKVLAHLFDGMMNAIIHQWIASAGDESLAAKAATISDTFLHGVLQERRERIETRGER